MVFIETSYDDAADGTNGACLACGEVIYGGIEPDARGYECEYCGEMKVYGLEELALMGKLSIVED